MEESKSRQWREQQQAAIMERRTKVREMWIGQNLPMRAIAERLGCSVFTVSEDMNFLLAKWPQENALDISLHVARELAQIDADMAEARVSFQASKKPLERQSASERKGGGPTGDDHIQTASVVTENREEGDPRFLEVCIKLRNQKIQLLGLNRWRDNAEEVKRPATLEEFVAAAQKQQIADRQQGLVKVSK